MPFFFVLTRAVGRVLEKLNPTIVRKIWGGEKLKKLKSLDSDNSEIEPIGETWEIYQEELPYLAKFIDTSQELSVQVHPGDDYARLHENSSGKTECWIILHADEGEGIYLGLKEGIGKEQLLKAINNQEQIQQLLNFYPVKKGDFFFVPAGSIHAIGKHVTLAEVQQNSGITYRVWDWNRLDHLGHARELHVEKSLEVINFDSACNRQDFFQYRQNLFENMGLTEVCHHSHFHLFLLKAKSSQSFQYDLKLNRPMSLMNLSGKKSINGIELSAYCSMKISDESRLELHFEDDGEVLLIY